MNIFKRQWDIFMKDFTEGPTYMVARSFDLMQYASKEEFRNTIWRTIRAYTVGVLKVAFLSFLPGPKMMTGFTAGFAFVHFVQLGFYFLAMTFWSFWMLCIRRLRDVGLTVPSILFIGGSIWEVGKINPDWSLYGLIIMFCLALFGSEDMLS